MIREIISAVLKKTAESKNTQTLQENGGRKEDREKDEIKESSQRKS